MQPTARSLADLLQVSARTHPDLAGCVSRADSWVLRFDGLGGKATPQKVQAWKFGALAAGMFPLADHLAEVALDGASVNMPFARFFAAR